MLRIKPSRFCVNIQKESNDNTFWNENFIYNYAITAHSLSHFDTREIKSSIFFFSKALISSSVGGGGTFFWFSSFFFISGPLFNKFGESLITVIPPKVSPKRTMGSLVLNAKLVSFGFLTGFFSAKALCFYTLRSYT